MTHAIDRAREIENTPLVKWTDELANEARRVIVKLSDAGYYLTRSSLASAVVAYEELTPKHPDNELLLAARGRARAHSVVEQGKARRFDWQPGDCTRYEFVVVEFGMGPNPTILVCATNFGLAIEGDREWWVDCVIPYLAGKLPRGMANADYMAAAVLRFVWCYLGVHGDDDHRQTLVDAGVIR